MTRLMDRQRMRIAAGALLLASFLEICGCNPARTCEQLRLTRLSTMPWQTLMQQCAQCLTADEMAVLGRVTESSSDANLRSGMLTDRTVQDVLLEMSGPSFDSHDDVSSGAGSGPGTGYAAWAGAEAHPNPEPIAWPIPESVLFLYDRSPEAGLAARRIGTGFVLSVRDPRHGEVDRYLVTARHVVDPEWAGCGDRNSRSITVRFNRWTGGVGYETIPLEGPSRSVVVTPADEVTDLAMIPLRNDTVPDLDRFKLFETSFDKLPTSEELDSLHHEQPIVTAGVSLPKMSGLMDFPVSDPGVISATKSRLPVRVRCSLESPAKPIQLWTIAASISEGVSGAPVYAEMERGPRREVFPVLVGVQSVVWPGKGIAGMTPVVALTDLVQLMLNRDQVAMDLRRGVPH